MSTQSRIIFVRNAISEGTAAVLAEECIEHLDKVIEELKTPDITMDLITTGNALMAENEMYEKVIELMAERIMDRRGPIISQTFVDEFIKLIIEDYTKRAHEEIRKREELLQSLE